MPAWPAASLCPSWQNRKPRFTSTSTCWWVDRVQHHLRDGCSEPLFPRKLNQAGVSGLLPPEFRVSKAKPSPQPGDVTCSLLPLARVALLVFVMYPTGKNSDKGPARNIFLLSGIFSTETLLVDNDGNLVMLEPLRKGSCVPVSEPRLSYPCSALLNDGEQFFSGTAELFHFVIEKKNDLRHLKHELGQSFI